MMVACQVTNDNLEQQAQALFNHFLSSESFELVKLETIPHLLETGKRPKGGAVSDGVPSIGAENVKKLGQFDYASKKFIPRSFADSMKKGRINGYELLIYKDGGKPGTFIPHFSMFGEGFPYTEFYINEHVFKLDFGCREKNIFAYFFFQTDAVYHWLASNGGKAAIPGINQQNIHDIMIPNLEDERILVLGKQLVPIFTTIFTNCKQNRLLAEVRDTLLPKLMSGEIDVSDIELGC